MKERLRKFLRYSTRFSEHLHGLTGPVQSILLPLRRLAELLIPLYSKIPYPRGIGTRIWNQTQQMAMQLKNRACAINLPGTERQRKAALYGIAGLLLVLEITGCLLAGFGATTAPLETTKTTKKRSGDRLYTENEQLQAKINAQIPEGIYIVVDTAGNRVYMKRGQAILKDMLASCGSGNVLEDPVRGRKWVFDTPRGKFQVLTKVTNPVWVKPDWAFLEDGEPIPGKAQDRAMPGMMGDYAIGIGNGYFLHGTLYSRLLGRNVSHGCVRLGDEDLEALYRNTAIGTRVLIF